MRGRKPIPTALHRLHGRPSKTAPPKYEPHPIGELCDAPGWFNDTQRAGWDYALRHAPPGLLKRLDRGALAVWVVAEDLHRQAAAAQAQAHLLVRAPDGEPPMQSPYLPVINRQALIMLRAAAELGFTPTSRSRAVAGSQAEVSPLDDFLASDPDSPIHSIGRSS